MHAGFRHAHGDWLEDAPRTVYRCRSMLLLDLLEYLTTPCSWRVRSMGFLTSSLQVQARFRRCRRAWEPHLAATRSAILHAADRCGERRKAVVLGAGLLHDIPLRELSASFREVILADIVFPWASRLAARRFANVRCVQADVTETIHSIAREQGAPLPRSQPARFLDEPALDFTVSVNLLSQLPVIPKRYLRRGDSPEVEAWSHHLQTAHLDYLRKLPGRVALISDTGGMHRDRAGAIVARWDNLHGLELPAPDAVWEWNLAPAPEADPCLDHLVRVAAFSDWKGQPCAPTRCIPPAEAGMPASGAPIPSP